MSMFGPEKSREFQQGMDQQSLRRNRENDRLSLRRKKREEQLQRKRRQIISTSSSSVSDTNSGGSNGGYSINNNINSSNSQLASTKGINIKTILTDNLAQYIKELKSENMEQRIHGTMCIRILLSKADKDPPYKEIVDSGIVPLLLSFFKCEQNQKLQFEAAWAVTNLCSSTKEICEVLCQYNAIKAFEHLLMTTKHFEIMEQAVWGLGNIAGESQQLRNTIIRDGIFQFLLERAEQFLKSKNYTLCRNAVWCLSNLLRYDGAGKKRKDSKDPPQDLCPWDNIKNMIPIFVRLLNEIGGKIKKKKIQIAAEQITQNDPEYNQCLQCCSDCLWTIQYTQCYIDLAPNCSYLQDIFNTNLIDIIILFMQMDSVILLSPSLRIIGTFVSGEDRVTLKILQKGFLKAAMLNLQCKVRMIRKEVCWVLSNIAGCEKDICIKLIEYENGQLLKSLVTTCLYDDDQVKKEAGWVLANIVSLSDPEIIHFMVTKGVIGALRAVMKTSSVKKPLITCMEAFDIIMSHSRARDEGPYDYVSKVEASGCVEIFDILQAGVDDNDKVFTTSYELCSKYWPDDGVGWQPHTVQQAQTAPTNNNDNNNTNNNDDSKTNGHSNSRTQQSEVDIYNNTDGSYAIDVTARCMQDPRRLAQDAARRAAAREQRSQSNGNNNTNNNTNQHDDDDDDDLMAPNTNGNQYSFGLNQNGNNNNNNNNNGNNNNGSNEPFQF